MNVRYEINFPVDSDALNKLFAAAWPAHSPVNFEPLLQKALLYVTAHCDNRIIGFAKIITDGGVHGFLLDTTVLPEFRRHGVGTTLVKHAIGVAKKHSLEWIHVDYETHLESFYAKCGFRPSAAGILRP